MEARNSGSHKKELNSIIRRKEEECREEYFRLGKRTAQMAEKSNRHIDTLTDEVVQLKQMLHHMEQEKEADK